MSRTHRERILDYLWSISPDWATNSQIREATGINSHQQVYLLTQELMHSRLIRGEQRGREWIFRADESLAIQLASPGRASYGELSSHAEKELSPLAFEDLARAVMGRHFGVPLRPGQVPGVPKEWDMVSPDGDILGDASTLPLSRGNASHRPSSPSLPSTSGCWKRPARPSPSWSSAMTAMCRCSGYNATVV